MGFESLKSSSLWNNPEFNWIDVTRGNSPWRKGFKAIGRSMVLASDN